MNEILSHSISFILGVAGSCTAWWLIQLKAPKIVFSDFISKQPDPDTGEKFRFYFKNASKRIIFEANIYAKLSIRGLNKRKHNLEVTYLPVSFDGKIPLVEPFKTTPRRNLLRINADKENEFTRDIYPEIIREKANQNTLNIEDLLNIGDESWVEIVIICSDQFSGTRKAIKSKKFYSSDIINKPFPL